MANKQKMAENYQVKSTSFKLTFSDIFFFYHLHNWICFSASMLPLLFYPNIGKISALKIIVNVNNNKNPTLIMFWMTPVLLKLLFLRLELGKLLAHIGISMLLMGGNYLSCSLKNSLCFKSALPLCGICSTGMHASKQC